MSFKRYLEIATFTGAKVAVITDNDGDVQVHCINKYTDFVTEPNIKICYDRDETQKTFEVVLYGINSALCDSLFGTDALTHMLANKTESAYALLSQKSPISVPAYIKEAIEWIRG